MFWASYLLDSVYAQIVSVVIKVQSFFFFLECVLQTMWLGWVLPPLSNSWIILIVIILLYIALNRTPNIDSYWGGSTHWLGKVHFQ